MRFGKWKTIGSISRDKIDCICDCNTRRMVSRWDLFSGKSKSCGCLTRNKKHGQSESRVYDVWCKMRSRCSNKKDKRFSDYGGRGITVCKRWNSFEHFLSDMGPRPDGYQIDRINNNGNYEPKNCRWATRQENSSNKRNSHLITFDGETRTLFAWSRIVGVNHNTLDWRIKKWGIKKAITTKKKW